MHCHSCHLSPWMRGKVLDFMWNCVENYQGRIEDNDFFTPLKEEGEEAVLEKLLRNHFSAKMLKKMSSTRDQAGFLLELDSDPVDVTLRGLWNKMEVRGEMKTLVHELLGDVRAKVLNGNGGEDVFHDRMQELQRTLKLADEEIDILLLALALEEGLFDTPWIRDNSFVKFAAFCLGCGELEIVRLLGEGGALHRYDFFDEDLDFNDGICGFLNGVNNEPLASSYYQKDMEPPLPWGDFSELGRRHGEILRRMLVDGGRPVSILLYGAPGTGKSSFARALAAKVGRACYCIAQCSRWKRSSVDSSVQFRFAALRVCDGQVNPGDSLIVVDEADNMLRGEFGRGGVFPFFGEGAVKTGDKGLLNSVLDELKCPSIWITNTPADELDESSRRRFDYSICFEPLNSEQRKCIWKNNIKRMKAGRLFTEEMVEEFSAKYPVSAGGVTLVVENLMRMRPKKSEVASLVEQLMKPHCRLMGVSLTDEKLLPTADYSLEGLNIHGKVKLERIVTAVRAFQNQKVAVADPDRPRMNLLLSGAPGTGKTEFVKYLGKMLNTKVNVKMGSDLLSSWVGETEQNIARAFREAEAEHAILFLDEIDGLVQSRTMAFRSWEVTQVNELLHQMENFNGVMIGATNFIQNLDQAIMRRFTFKLQFDYLDENGKRVFFERMFKSSLTDGERLRLNTIPNLAPGDFRTVRQSLFYYGGEVDNAQRLEALERESAARSSAGNGGRGKIGF